jgi:hypothetical protein
LKKKYKKQHLEGSSTPVLYIGLTVLKGKEKKKYTFERVEHFKYLGVILNEDNQETDLQDRIKNTNKIYFMLRTFLEIKIYTKN